MKHQLRERAQNMHGLSDKDWEALSAYHDGELPAPARAALEARLAHEPALARALAEITGLSDGLRRLHPVQQPAAVAEALTPAIAPPANLPHAPSRLLRFGATATALAACLALAIGLASLLHNTTPGPRALHQELSTLELSPEPQLTPAALGDWPDLGAARLAPVAQRDLSGGTMAHYSGLNGCRLSYFRGPNLPALDRTDGTPPQSATWQTADGLYHLILASGMDAARFDAIAAYLEHLSRGEAGGSQLAALSDKTKTATPCLG